ncbi:beta-adducin [Apteryx rowi]|uniref:beta-adducin n=1 Tax=Apteryx rowi TaxID=308060 RepID=UPI000E1CCE96|nr:beta-adducin [Apteryx rowi]
MSAAASPEPLPSPPAAGPRYFDRFSADDPEYLRARNMAADLRQDFNMMEQKKRVTMILQSPSFREELESLIQEQMKKGNNSSNIWALRQIADFMASTSPAVFPTSPMGPSTVTPINDLQGAGEALPLAKGERLMRCKVGSVYRLLDLYGWAQLSDTYVTLRVSKEQDHFLISPKGLSCSEVTASSLGYRTGYTYRYPFVQEKSKPKSDVLIPATVTAFVFEEEAAAVPALRQHAHKQQKEKTRWLNTPNTYLRVDVAGEQPGGPRTKTTWLKADEVEKGSGGGTAIRIENPNQFVPLYTDPQEVLEMRNKIREQNRQDVKSAGPQSQLLASVIAETSRSPSTESHLGAAEAAAEPRAEAPAEPEPPNPFSQLTDRELEEYRREVERKKLPPHGSRRGGGGGGGGRAAGKGASPNLTAPPFSLLLSLSSRPGQGDEEADGGQAPAEPPDAEPEPPPPPAPAEEEEEEEEGKERVAEEAPSRGGPRAPEPGAPKERGETAPSSPASPDGSPSKSPSKKKKKFRTPSFLKKGKKKEKVEA